MRAILTTAILVLAGCSAEPTPEAAKENAAAPVVEQPAFRNPVAVPSPQDELFAYLERKAGAASDCSNMPSDFEFCHPKPVTVPDREARLARAHMIAVDELMAPCDAKDAQSCFEQRDQRALVRKLGWCAKTSLSREATPNVLWARCGEPSTTVVHEAE